MSLLVIAAIFGMSLLAAWVIFKFLKGTANVTNPGYQLGGAAGGFVVFFGVLATTYIQVNNNLTNTALQNAKDENAKLQSQITDLMQKYVADEALLKDERGEALFQGTVSPTPGDPSRVILSVADSGVDRDGKFFIKAHHVKSSDFPLLYVIGPKSPYKQVFKEDDTGNLKIVD